MAKLPTREAVAAAWYGIPHEYGTRRNKALDGKQWEVYRSVKDQPIDDDNPKVLGLFETQEQAERRQIILDDRERAEAVLALFSGTR